MELNKIYQNDCIEGMRMLPDGSVHTCVTSPPYWGLRDYGVEGQIGLEETPEAYVKRMVTVFREVWRVLRDDGTLWLNLGDSYAANIKGSGGKTKKQSSNNGSFFEPRKIEHGLKPKDLVGIPWRVAFALQADGWYLRSDIVWNKINVMPESVTDRPTKAHEYIFLLSKSQKYYYDADLIKEPANQESAGRYKYGFSGRKGLIMPDGKEQQIAPKGMREFRDKRNKRTVWTVATKPFKDAHFATFPPDLIEPCVLAGSPENGIVLDPFFGSGTTGIVALKNNRNFIGIELNPEYIEIANKRLGLLPVESDRIGSKRTIGNDEQLAFNF